MVDISILNERESATAFDTKYNIVHSSFQRENLYLPIAFFFAVGGKTSLFYENFANSCQKQFPIKPSFNCLFLFGAKVTAENRFQTLENKLYLPSHTVKLQYLLGRKILWQRSPDDGIVTVYLLQIGNFSSVFFGV